MISPTFQNLMFMELALSAKRVPHVGNDSKERTYIRHAERKYKNQVASINSKLADIASLKEQLNNSAPKQKHELIAEVEEEFKSILSVFNELRMSGQHSDKELANIERIIRSLANTLHKKKKDLH